MHKLAYLHYNNRLMVGVMNAILWSAICGLSAVPSAVWALGFNDLSFDGWAILVGLAPFIVAYAVAPNTPWFPKLAAQPFVRRTLKIGFGIRLAISVIFPLGMYADYPTGRFCFEFIESHMPSSFVPVGPGSNVLFGATLLITLLQGVLLNLILITLMAVVWGIQAVACQWPSRAPQGFPIEPNQAE